MNQQILRGARLRNCILQDDDVRIEITCDYTDEIREEMDWDEPGMSTKLMTFDDEIGAGSLKISADQKDLENGTTEIAFPFDSASGFRCVRCTEKGKESTRLELRFHVYSTAPEAVELCRAYKRTVKRGMGQMRFTVGAAAPESSTPLLDAMNTEAEDARRERLGLDRISNAAGMQAGKRGRGRPRKEQLAAAVAAEAPTVTIDEEEERRQPGEVLAQALDEIESSTRYEELN